MDARLLPANVGKEKGRYTRKAQERTRESNNKKEMKAGERANREVVFRPLLCGGKTVVEIPHMS